MENTKSEDGAASAPSATSILLTPSTMALVGSSVLVGSAIGSALLHYKSSEKKLLEEEQESFRSWVSSLGAVPAITKLQSKADAIRAAELKRADAKLANLSQREIEAVERLSRGIVSKLLHGPMSALRSDDAPEKKKNALGVLKNMFGV